MKITNQQLRRIIKEELSYVLREQVGSTIHFMNWLIDKTKRVHSQPGQGSIFAMPIEKVVEKVKEIASGAGNVEEIANTTGVLSANVPNIGYDLVVPVVDGQPMHKGRPLQGQITTTQKEEGPNTIDVPAIITSEPMESFETDQLTVIIRPMKNQEGQVLPNEYIILSAFPGSTAADKRASDWNGEYMVVIPQG
jgi:hypothetical protein